jgi:signal transduction histidine kinase
LPAQLDAINDLAKSGDWGTVQHRLDYELKPIETQASILVGSIQQQANGELAQAVLKMGSAQRRILFIVPVTAIFTSFIAAFFGWVITRRIVELRLEERVSERTRIARELHDTLIQSVDGLMLYLQAAMDEPDRERSHQMLEKALDRADEVLSEGRERVHTLRTESITANDLSQALTGYGEERAQDHATEFSVTLIGNPRPLDPIIRDEVFRIGREALANAFQHSGASKIEVELTYDRNEIRLRIRDDGSGIDPLIVETGKAGHWGLSGMRERANRVGAELNVWSGPNVGTEIDLTISARVAYQRRFSIFPLSWIGSRASGERS